MVGAENRIVALENGLGPNSMGVQNQANFFITQLSEIKSSIQNSVLRIRSEVEGAANERANDRARLDRHDVALVDLRSDMMQLREENAEL